MSTPTQVASRYRIDGRLGAGGMSTVFLGMDNVLERPVAIKLLAEHLADDDSFVARFRREALAAARLQHPNIVQVFDSGQDADSGRHYIVMEYVDGPSCADLLRDEGQLAIERSVQILRDACHGLDYAHRAGVVHRDVKPGNLLVASETGTTKLADFGIAKAAEQSRMTQVGSVLGTAAYLSPEQARGDEAEGASDIYSLGVCGYQFLTGRLPHEYSSLTELALKQQEEQVVPISSLRGDVPAELDRTILACLERDPNARYASGAELAEALEAGMHGISTAATQALTRDTLGTDNTDATQAMQRTGLASAPPITPPRPQPAPARRAAAARPAAKKGNRRRLWAALLVLLAGVIAAVAIITSGGAGPETRVIEDNVPDQVQGLKDFIEQNRR